MKNYMLYSLIISIALLALGSAVARTPSNDIRVVTNAKHIKLNSGVSIQYTFDVYNNSNNTVHTLTVGEKSQLDKDPSIAIPDGESVQLLFNAPQNWVGQNQHMPESLLNSWHWSVKEGAPNINAVQARSLKKGYSVVTPARYSTVLDSYASLDVSTQGFVNVKINKGDINPPVGNISLVKTPIILNGKVASYKINLKIVAIDNYDPYPEITFDSIGEITTSSSNTPVSPFKVNYTINIPNNIKTGSYPTEINIPVDLKFYKKYIINYKIKDASENQRIISTTVVIPKQ